MFRIHFLAIVLFVSQSLAEGWLVGLLLSLLWTHQQQTETRSQETIPFFQKTPEDILGTHNQVLYNQSGTTGTCPHRSTHTGGEPRTS